MKNRSNISFPKLLSSYSTITLTGSSFLHWFEILPLSCAHFLMFSACLWNFYSLFFPPVVNMILILLSSDSPYLLSYNLKNCILFLLYLIFNCSVVQWFLLECEALYQNNFPSFLKIYTPSTSILTFWHVFLNGRVYEHEYTLAHTCTHLHLQLQCPQNEHLLRMVCIISLKYVRIR